MTTRYAFIVVEGPHDRAFVTRVLESLGFERFEGKAADLDPAWAAWRPTYPKDDNLYSPLDMPSILHHDRWSVGVYVAGGGQLWSKKTGFKLRLKNQGAFVELLKSGALAFVLDSDNEDAASLVKRLHQLYKDLLPALPAHPDEISTAGPRVGAFVVPERSKRGTVECLLLETGRSAHGPLIDAAAAFVEARTADELTHFAPFDHLKARVAVAASILRPGSTNTVTIEKDQWITADALTHPALLPFVNFICSLLELPRPASPPPPDDVQVLLDLLEDT